MAGPCAGVGGNLHQVGAHLTHKRQLCPCRRLAASGDHRAADRRLQRVLVPRRIPDGLDPLPGQVFHRISDGGAVVEAAGRNLQPRPVQRVLELLGGGAGRGAGQVGEESARLGQPGAKNRVHPRRRKDVRLPHPRSGVDGGVGCQGPLHRLRHQPPQLLPAPAGNSGKARLDLALQHPHSPQLLALVLGGGDIVVILGDLLRHMGEDAALHLAVQFHQSVRDACQVLRRQHYANPKASASGSLPPMALACSSVSPYHLARNSHACMMPSRTSWRSRCRVLPASSMMESSKFTRVSNAAVTPRREATPSASPTSACSSSSSCFLRLWNRSDFSLTTSVAVLTCPCSKLYRSFPMPHLQDSSASPDLIAASWASWRSSMLSSTILFSPPSAAGTA